MQHTVYYTMVLGACTLRPKLIRIPVCRDAEMRNLLRLREEEVF
jgi:hypothetical protein